MFAIIDIAQEIDIFWREKEYAYVKPANSWKLNVDSEEYFRILAERHPDASNTQINRAIDYLRDYTLRFCECVQVKRAAGPRPKKRRKDYDD